MNKHDSCSYEGIRGQSTVHVATHSTCPPHILPANYPALQPSPEPDFGTLNSDIMPRGRGATRRQQTTRSVPSTRHFRERSWWGGNDATQSNSSTLARSWPIRLLHGRLPHETTSTSHTNKTVQHPLCFQPFDESEVQENYRDEPIHTTMRLLVLTCLVASLGLTLAGDEKEDVGTVIGIDLGTTYSWWVALLCACAMFCYLAFLLLWLKVTGYTALYECVFHCSLL